MKHRWWLARLVARCAFWPFTAFFFSMLGVLAFAAGGKTFNVPSGDKYGHELGHHYFRSQRVGSHEFTDEKAIILSVTVDAGGNVQSAQALTGRRELFRDVEAFVKKTKFRPFLQDGRAVRARFRYEVAIVPQEDWQQPRVPFPDVHDWTSLRIKLTRRTCHNGSACFWYSVEVYGDGRVE